MRLADQTLRYTDTLYGIEEIGEPVLTELVQTAALQRLKGVLQHGITGLLGITSRSSRFDHSMGVMILARRLGAPLREQIAALLHDVSHTAFSHVIDYVVGGHDQQHYHEEVKEDYLLQTDVPAVLERHGYAWRDFLHETHFPILEQPAPALCADRLDYFFRDSRDLGLASHAQLESAIQGLVVVDGRIGVDNLETARWMANTFIAADDASWSNFWEVGLYEVTAQAIRLALQLGEITKQDFWETDQKLWEKLNATGSPELEALLKCISPKTHFIWDDRNPTFRVKTKIRTIDPGVLVDGVLTPLSELDAEFGRFRDQYLQRKSGMWPVRVEAG